ncbi:sirohydrochlorin chelatase, partial [Mycobacterium ulcerans]
PRGATGPARVVVVSYLLAEGLFQERLRACGADVVTPPLGNHPGLAELIATRFHSAISAAVPTVPRSPMHTRAESHETQSIVG